MPLIPYGRYEIVTPLSPSEVAARLAAVTEPVQWFRSSPTGRLFEGAVDGMTFSLQRIIKYRNSFLPLVVGRIEQSHDGGSRICMRMRMTIGTIVGVSVWMIVVVSGAFGLLWSRVRTGDWPRNAFIAPLMVAFGWALPTFAFGFEVRPSLRTLEDLVGGRRVPPRSGSEPKQTIV